MDSKIFSELRVPTRNSGKKSNESFFPTCRSLDLHPPPLCSLPFLPFLPSATSPSSLLTPVPFLPARSLRSPLPFLFSELSPLPCCACALLNQELVEAQRRKAEEEGAEGGCERRGDDSGSSRRSGCGLRRQTPPFPFLLTSSLSLLENPCCNDFVSARSRERDKDPGSGMKIQGEV